MYLLVMLDESFRYSCKEERENIYKMIIISETNHINLIVTYKRKEFGLTKE
jgi:hypothetical protein